MSFNYLSFDYSKQFFTIIKKIIIEIFKVLQNILVYNVAISNSWLWNLTENY